MNNKEFWFSYELYKKRDGVPRPCYKNLRYLPIKCPLKTCEHNWTGKFEHFHNHLKKSHEHDYHWTTRIKNFKNWRDYIDSKKFFIIRTKDIIVPVNCNDIFLPVQLKRFMYPDFEFE